MSIVMKHISAWACLIRSDYNFVFLFFAYFYLVSRKDHVSLTIVIYWLIQLFYMIIGLCVLDLFFFLFVPSTWMSYEENNIVWNNLHGMHVFAIFCSAIIFILKVNPFSFQDSHHLLFVLA